MRLTKWLLFLIIPTTLTFASPDTFLQVNFHDKHWGMFAAFYFVAGVLYEYDTNDFAGIEVDFEDFGLYYDPAYGSNWWEYFCEPICLGDKTNATIKNFGLNESAEYALFARRNFTPNQVHDIINKYIKIRPEIQKKVDQFVHENFSGNHVIGIHYRGTDKKVEAPRIPYQEVLDHTNEYIYENSIQDYKIFVATDEEPFVEFIQNAFPNTTITYSTMRSNSCNDKATHLKFVNNFLHGEESLIDCLLLSRSDILIKTTSNLSSWSTYFNPLLPVIALSKHYNGDP